MLTRIGFPEIVFCLLLSTAVFPLQIVIKADDCDNQHSTQSGSRHVSTLVSTEERIADCTWALAWCTGLLAASTIPLWYETRRTINKQIRDTQASVKASEDAVSIAKNSLVAANRPWIKVGIEVDGAITYDVNGALLHKSWTRQTA